MNMDDNWGSWSAIGAYIPAKRPLFTVREGRGLCVLLVVAFWACIFRVCL